MFLTEVLPAHCQQASVEPLLPLADSSASLRALTACRAVPCYGRVLWFHACSVHASCHILNHLDSCSGCVLGCVTGICITPGGKSPHSACGAKHSRAHLHLRFPHHLSAVCHCWHGLGRQGTPHDIGPPVQPAESAHDPGECAASDKLC